ncbi:hypothetical protein PsorP6_006078 [Peronosclerospora sorghi]|uniref:Uncharacterized protein n=1 Tax=Peronosclerospora sorghi TaxID=230839 RepID=A0ACC0W576_9STRA|nr:hypothetical protein PsorP6_006078 [Peronosclerospora sorghi]
MIRYLDLPVLVLRLSMLRSMVLSHFYSLTLSQFNVIMELTPLMVMVFQTPLHSLRPSPHD